MTAAAALIARDFDAEAAMPRDHSAPASIFVPRLDAVAKPLELSLVSGRAGFNALESEWNALFASSARSHHVFLGFSWLWHWCNHYLPADGKGGTRLAIVTGRRDGRLVMVWPLVLERSRGLDVLYWMGEPMSQYGDVLIEDMPDSLGALRQAWTFIAETTRADVARLRKIRADSAVAPLIVELGGRVTEALEAPYLDLASAANYADYEKRYSSGARRNRRRLMRRFEEQGKVTFEEFHSGPEARDLIALAVELKRKWLVSRGLISKAFADDRIIRFFGDVAEAGEQPAGCRVAVLKCDGRPAAIEISLRCRDRMALHIVVFDLEFEKAGAGVLLFEECFRRAADSGVGCYDLLAPGDGYKKDWADASVAVNDWALPFTVAGRAYASLYLGVFRSAAKQAVAMLPQNVRSRLSATLSRALTKS